jgi:hypothetical protein
MGLRASTAHGNDEIINRVLLVFVQFTQPPTRFCCPVIGLALAQETLDRLHNQLLGAHVPVAGDVIHLFLQQTR